MMFTHSPLPHPSVLKQLWLETSGAVAFGWAVGITVAVFWIYSGMPLICH